MTTLYYFHDPMCSWCWGYRPCAQQLFAHLPDAVTRMNVLGGLAPDTDKPMPREQRAAIASYWRRIEEMLGTEFNYDFWTECEPRRSTYPSCRAVIAAARQGCEEEMILAIQTAYYLEARNPSDTSTLEQLAAQLDLDTELFAADIRSPEIEEEFQRQLRFTRSAQVSGFPSLALKSNGQITAIAVDYRNWHATLNDIQSLLG